MNLLLFVIFLGGLILVHEFGHYLAARVTGVRVKVFSIGFGPRIIGARIGETDYRISAIPLGGYVRFLGDDPDEPPPPELAKRGFLTTDLWRKFVIVLAGPSLNLLLPFVVFWSLHAATSELPPAIIGTVAAGGPGDLAGLKPGDRVVAVNGKEIEYWWELRQLVVESAGREVRLTVERGQKRLRVVVRPEVVKAGPLGRVGLGREEGRIEVSAHWELPVILVEEGSQAYQLGFRSFDVIAAVDGVKPYDISHVERLLGAASSETVEVAVLRFSEKGNRSKHLLKVPKGLKLQQLGVSDARMTVRWVEEGSPAHKAGIRPMDRIVELDGKPIRSWTFFEERLYGKGKTKHSIVVERDSRKITVVVDIANPEWTPGAAVPRLLPLGVKAPIEVATPEPIPNRGRLRYAALIGTDRAVESIETTLLALYGMVVGKVSVKELGGPIMVYDVAVSAGKRGLQAFLRAMAWISASLGILNLLPIPILDGGHLLIFFVEAVRRKPVGRRGRQYAAYIGLAFLAALMVLVFANDIQRKFGIRL